MCRHFRAGRRVLADSCIVLYIVRKTLEKVIHTIVEESPENAKMSNVNETNASSEKQEEGLIEKIFFSEFFVRIEERSSWFFNNII